MRAIALWLVVWLASSIQFALPGFALARFVAGRRHLESWAVVAWGLVGMGGTALATFWATLVRPAFGLLVAAGLPVTALVYLILCVRRGWGLKEVRPLLPPILLSAGYALLVCALGFLPGAESSYQLAATRFTHPLPFDNTLPHQFAGLFANGFNPSAPPHIGDWLSSDRPPLEVGAALQVLLPLRHVVTNGTALALSSMVALVGVQTWILIAVWSILLALQIRRQARLLVLIVLCGSPWVIVNTFYVWPKLLAVAFLAPAVAVAVGARPVLRQNAVLLGLSTGLALMTHGTAVFALVGLATLALLRPSVRRASVRPLMAAFAAVAVIYGAWMAYQKWEDPPGDRLLKWQLAGVSVIDSRSFFMTLVDSYRRIGLLGALEAKGSGVTSMVELRASVVTKGVPLLDSVMFWLRVQNFFDLAWTVAPLLVLVPAVLLLLRRHNSLSRTVGLLLGAAALITIWWIVMMFSPDNFHESAHLVPALVTIALVVAGYEVWPRFTRGVAAVAVLGGFFLMYPVHNEVTGRMEFLIGTPASWVVLLAAVVTFTATVLGLWRPWTIGRLARRVHRAARTELATTQP